MRAIKSLRNMLYFSRNSWVLALSAAFWSIGGSMVNPFQPLFYYALGAPAYYIGILAAVSSATTAVSYIVGGVIADSYGRKRIITTFSVVAAASSFIYVFIFSWPMLFIPIIVGALSGIYSPAFNATINDSVEPTMRPMAFASFTLITTIPSVFMPYVGGLLIERFGELIGLKIGFFVSGLLGVIATLWRARNLEETHVGNRSVKLDAISWLKETLTAYKTAPSAAKKLLLYALLASMATGLSTVYVSIYVINSLRVPPPYYGILIGLSSLVTAALVLPAAGIVKRLGLRRAAVLSALFSPLSMLTFVSAAGMMDLLAWSVTGGVSGAMLSPSIQTLQGNLTTKEARGRWMGMFALVPLVGTAPFQLLSGFLYVLSPVITFAASIPFYAAAVYVLSTIDPEGRDGPSGI